MVGSPEACGDAAVNQASHTHAVWLLRPSLGHMGKTTCPQHITPSVCAHLYAAALQVAAANGVQVVSGIQTDTA